MVKKAFKTFFRLFLSWINLNIVIADLYIMINGDVGFWQIAICCACLFGFLNNLKRGLE